MEREVALGGLASMFALSFVLCGCAPVAGCTFSPSDEATEYVEGSADVQS